MDVAFFGRNAQIHVGHAPPIGAAKKENCTKKSILLSTQYRQELWTRKAQECFLAVYSI